MNQSKYVYISRFSQLRVFVWYNIIKKLRLLCQQMIHEFEFPYIGLTTTIIIKGINVIDKINRLNITLFCLII